MALLLHEGNRPESHPEKQNKTTDAHTLGLCQDSLHKKASNMCMPSTQMKSSTLACALDCCHGAPSGHQINMQRRTAR